MAKIARAEPGTTLFTEGVTFQFGDDGGRQVSETEVELLQRYRANGGDLKIEIEDAPASKRKE